MKKRIVLLTLCCISLLCIGYPLSKKISSSKDKTVQVSETDNTKTSAVNLPQEDNTKTPYRKTKILLSPRQRQNPLILLILQKPIIP